MSDLTRSSDAGIEGNSAVKCNPQTRQAGVGIVAGEACYIDANGLLQKASTAAVFTGATGTVAFSGLAARTIPSGTYGEIYGNGAEFFYADSGLTINSYLWASATAGKIADAKVGSAADLPIAQVVTATNIIVLRGV